MSAYARQAVARSAAGFTVSGQAVTLFATVSFPAVATGSATVTHMGVGLALTSTGQLVFFGAVTPNITIAAGVTPQLSTGTTVTESGAGNTAGTNLLLLLFNNTAWADFGSAGGIQPSSPAGSLYLSLHTSSPGASGDQTSNEVSYS